jgi:hypothetical protein
MDEGAFHAIKTLLLSAFSIRRLVGYGTGKGKKKVIEERNTRFLFTLFSIGKIIG